MKMFDEAISLLRWVKRATIKAIPEVLLIMVMVALMSAAFGQEHQADKPSVGVPTANAATHAELQRLEQIELRILLALKEMQQSQAQKPEAPK